MQGLPPQSRIRTAVNDGNVEPTKEVEVLADLFDAMATFDWHFVTANSDENKPKPKRPKPYPRWWVKGAGQAKQPPVAQRVARLEDARRRKREREQAIAEGRIS